MMGIKALVNHKNPSTQRIWRRGVSNELQRLMKGGDGIKGTNTMHPILKSKMQKDKRACFHNGWPIFGYKKKKFIESE